MRRMEQRAPRRLVHAARLHAHEPVLHHVGPADAVLAGERVQRLEQLDWAQGDVIHRHRRPFLEADLDHRRQVGRLERVPRHDEDVLRGFFRRILEDATLMRAVPQVAVGGIGFVDGRLDRDAFRLHVSDQVLATLEGPLAPRGDHLQLGCESGVRELEAHLVVALAGAAVGDGLGADLLRERHVMRGHRGAGHRRAEEVGARVDGAGAQRGEHEVAHEFLAQVFDHAVGGAGPLGLLDQAAQLARPLPHVRRETENPGAVLLAEPGNDRGCVESARIRENHQRPHGTLLVGLCSRMHKHTTPGPRVNA